MEIATVEPMWMDRGNDPFVKAGTMAVVPHQNWDDQTQEDLPEIPPGTLLCSGQTLPRASYPELSQLYSHDGGFYQFRLPNLLAKFIVGVNPEGEYQMGDGVIYYASVPPINMPKRGLL